MQLQSFKLEFRGDRATILTTVQQSKVAKVVAACLMSNKSASKQSKYVDIPTEGEGEGEAQTTNTTISRKPDSLCFGFCLYNYIVLCIRMCACVHVCVSIAYALLVASPALWSHSALKGIVPLSLASKQRQIN